MEMLQKVICAVIVNIQHISSQFYYNDLTLHQNIYYF